MADWAGWWFKPPGTRSNGQTKEAVLDDGTVLQDEGEGDVFAFKAEVDHNFCELRVLDAQGNILESIVPEYEAGPLPTSGSDC